MNESRKRLSKLNMNTDTKFKNWMLKVNAACEHLYGMSIHDLPDYCFRDAFDDGVSPVAVAKDAMREAF